FMPVSGRVTVTVFDLLGRKVLNIAENQWQPAGWHTVELDGQKLAGGIYFYQLEYLTENGFRQRQTRKMVLIK
ncbi:T9SS type A sorting domain-containing protein, partial [candidate division KSB1 bacterium]|nr:T9SS type A sorting domain-containing protein [candidate division KSB1 bacterium]